MEISTVNTKLPSVSLSQSIAHLVIKQIHLIRQTKSHTHLAFEFSPTTISVFQTLASSIYAEQLNWHKIHLYPLDSAPKAQIQLEKNLFKYVDFPPHHFHPQIPMEKTFDILIFHESTRVDLPQSHYQIQIR